jgi:hypothetical protein
LQILGAAGRRLQCREDDVADQNDLRTTVNLLADRAAICDLFSRFTAGGDVHDWALVAACFAPDAVVDLSRPAWDGTNAVWTGIDEVMSNLKAGLSKHFVQHHMVTNHRCVIEGDRARVVAYLRSSHLDHPEEPTRHGDQGAWYLSELARIDGEWKISYLKPISVWWNQERSSDGPLANELLIEMRDYLGGGNGAAPDPRAGTDDRDLAATVRWLADRDAIADLFARFTGSSDVQDWDGLADCFSSDIMIDRSRPTPDGQTNEAWVGLEQVMQGVKAEGSRHFLGHHMLSNHRFVIDGNRARAVAYLHSVHVDDRERPADYYAHGAVYLTELQRVDGSWKFSYLKHIPVWMPAALAPVGPFTDSQRTEIRDFLATAGSPTRAS